MVVQDKGHGQRLYTVAMDSPQAGFHMGEGDGPGIPPPQPQFSLPRNLEIEYGYYISYYVSSKCSEILSQIASEAI